MNTVAIAPLGLLVIVAVIVGLVMLVRALPPGSGPKVALGAGGLLALAFLFIGYQRVTELRPVPINVQLGPKKVTNFGTFPATDFHQPAASAMPTYSNLLLILLGLAVLVGLVFLIYSLARSSGGRVALGAGGLVVVLLMFMSFFYLSKGQIVERQMAVRQEQLMPRVTLPPQAIELRNDSELIKSTPSEASVNEPEPKAFAPETNAEKPNGKPAWLTQGTQTGNGVSQFPISSELFSTVTECQKDLDSRMPALIASEAQFLVGEEYPITLFPGESKSLIADTYTEEVTTSQGTWYKVHRLIKIDQSMWASFRTRFHQAQLQARLETIGLGFGGLMLVLGVVYLFLRRKPRVVDPTLNTFSTT